MVMIVDGAGNIVMSDDVTLVATIGVSDLIIIKSADAILVVKKDQAQRVREIVESLTWIDEVSLAVPGRRLAPCGTIAAYRRHLYRDEQPCEACREATRIASRKEYASRSPEKHAWYMRNMAKLRRESHLRRTYGITAVEFEQLFQSQGFCCACCKSTDPKSDQGWCIDHEHGTKIIRGILCSPCNRGIGFLGDTLEGVQKALTYLGSCTALKVEKLPSTSEGSEERGTVKTDEDAIRIDGGSNGTNVMLIATDTCPDLVVVKSGEYRTLDGNVQILSTRVRAPWNRRLNRNGSLQTRWHAYNAREKHWIARDYFTLASIKEKLAELGYFPSSTECLLRREKKKDCLLP
jgi:hypothetical protein